jgi:tRNA(Ile)-lysidine synthase
LIDSASPSASELTAALLTRCAFPPAGTEVACAVSGGADSMALLILARASGCSVTAVHVDHGLRAGSAHEAGVVSAAATRFGAAFRSERVRVEPGSNLEARAREARFAVLPSDVLTGHTADDQAETVLINLLRGAGLDGLSGMTAEGHPILDLRRQETVDLCRAYELNVVHDPTNDDPRFVRNRLRHEILPLLADVAQRDVAAVIARQASLLRDDADLLDLLASDLDPTDAKALTSAPVAVARRAVRRWLANPMPPSADEVDRVLAVARGDVIACEIEGGRRIARTAWTLRAESS